MPAAVPLAAAAVGSAVAASSIGATITLGLGLGFSGAMTAGYMAGAVAAMAINAVGSRALAKKPKQPSFNLEAQGRTAVIRSAVESHRVVYGRARVSGPLIFAQSRNTGPRSTGDIKTGDNAFLHLVIPLAGHEIDAIESVFLDDISVQIDDDFVRSLPFNRVGYSYVRVRRHLGGPGQVADPLLVAECEGWTEAHRLRGIAYIYVRLEYDLDAFPRGIPNISALVRGKKVYDPRFGTSAWTDNAALCIRDYLASDYGFACDPDEIDDAHAIAAANLCDEAVATASGTSKRYTCNGILDTASTPLDNLQQLVTSVAGAVTYVQGKFRIHAAAYDAPSGAITNDMLAGDQVRTIVRTPRKELFNAVKGTYVEPAKVWQPTDFPPVSNGFYEAQDGGERIDRDVELPFTTDGQAAQRLAKILLEKSRQGITQTLTVNHSALRHAVYDVVTRTDPALGWVDKPFRIMKFEIDVPGPITMTLVEESPASYDWDAGEATVRDPAPDTSLPNVFDVAPPGAPTVLEELYAPLGGSAARSRAIITWAPSADQFVRDYQVEYRRAKNDDWAVAGRTDGTRLEVQDIAEGSYIFRVKAFNSLGVSSPYASNPATINGLSLPPVAITGFSLNAIHNNAHLSWDQSADIDVRVGGKIRLRYTPDLLTPSWSAAVDLGPALPGVATQATVPLLTGTYMIKAVDSAGNESLSATTIVSTVADIVKMNTVATSDQHPGFAGAKTNMVVSGSDLKLDGTALFDDGPGDFDDSTGYFDSGGTAGFAPFGEYIFDHSGDDYLDIGKVATSRVTAMIAAREVNELDTFDERGGLFDDATGLFDGDDVTGVEAKLFVRTTDDDPSGSPTWGEWRQFFVGDYTCRAFQFKLAAQSNDPALNVEVSALSVTVDMPDITDTGSLTTGTGGRTAIVFAKDFYAAPRVGGTILDAASGDYFDIQNIADTGFEIGVKNAAGSYVARAVHWHANGY